MTDEQITAALAEVGAAWLMDDQDELCQARAMRHLAASAVAAERERMNVHAVVLANTERLVERDRCAMLCDELAASDDCDNGHFDGITAEELASRIRSEG